MTPTVAAKFADIDAARESDIEGVHALLSSYADAGNLLPRSVVDISRNLDEFVVVRDRDAVVGCAALEIFSHDLGEVRSLAVGENHGGRGIGASLVERIERRARELTLRRLMALTYVPVFFHQLGFKTVPKNTLPEKIWGVCIRCYKFHNCDEIAVLKYLDKSALI